MSNTYIGQVNQAAAKATGRRYCTHHQGEVSIDAGSHVMRNKTRRWICFRCQEKRGDFVVVAEARGR